MAEIRNLLADFPDNSRVLFDAAGRIIVPQSITSSITPMREQVTIIE